MVLPNNLHVIIVIGLSEVSVFINCVGWAGSLYLVFTKDWD